MPNPYGCTFREILTQAGMSSVDPRHAEVWARVEWGTLDGLSLAALQRFVDEMPEVLTNPHADTCEALARSYGL